MAHSACHEMTWRVCSLCAYTDKFNTDFVHAYRIVRNGVDKTLIICEWCLASLLRSVSMVGQPRDFLRERWGVNLVRTQPQVGVPDEEPQGEKRAREMWTR